MTDGSNADGFGRYRTTRRRTLAGIGGILAGTTGVAGCLGGATEDPERDGLVAVASFFTFYDFARQVADGTSVTVENLVPTGLHGHGWEPDPSITRDIADADAFVHVGADFQPWADRAIETVRSDDEDTHLINVREGIDLIDLADSVEEDEQVGDGKDPHFWLDPIRATESVDNIVEGLAEIAPDEEAALADNAEGVKSDLEEIDAEWESIVEEADREVAFLAAHNAFEYVAGRYDLTIQPLVTNLAAADDVRPADMRRAQDTIDEHDIRTIGAAVFESRRPAEQLLAETDVEAYYPVTPYAGTSDEWVDRGWGYAEIARNINMETFTVVLDAGEPGSEFVTDWENFE